jgi:adenylate cyclase
MAEFAVPSGAVEAAIAVQRGIRDRFAYSEVPVRLRIGVNAGEPIEEGGDLHGVSVVIAKRLESAAENGGILVSEVVRQAVAGKEFEFVDRGEISLKGFDEPVQAWSVEW